MERKLAAILAADVVGYAALMERDESGTHERLVSGRKELFEPEIARHHGRIFKLMGDGLLAEFGSVVDAVECAVSLQRGLAERNANVPEDRRIHVRIGINLGEVIVEGEDRYGEGVNVAARLEQLADPDGIYVSGKVVQEVEKKLAFGFQQLGPQQVKNIAEPVPVYRVLIDGPATPRSAAKAARPRRVIAAGAAALILAIAIGGFAAWQSYNSPSGQFSTFPLPDKPSIVVLPFDSISDDSKWQRLADAVTEDITTNLSQSRDLFVIARNTSETYKGKAVDVQTVGRELGVQYVLEGSVGVAGDSVRITAQLIEASTRNHVWSQRYEGDVGDIANMQDDVTRKISGTLTGYEGVVAEAGRAAALRKPPASLAAYDLYLLGMAEKHKETQEDNIKAQQFFRKALEIDPNFARAYVALTWTYSYEIMLGYTESWERTTADLDAVARKALALDPYDAETHAAVATAYGYKGEFEQARVEFDRALSLGPNNADTLIISAWTLPIVGEPERAADLVEQAVRLNPVYPAWYNRSMSIAYYYSSQFDKALAAARRIQNPQKENLLLLALIYGQLGRQADAEATLATILKHDPGFTVEEWIWNPVYFAARDVELNLYLDGARKAGLPMCASKEFVKANPDLKPLPECELIRSKT